MKKGFQLVLVLLVALVWLGCAKTEVKPNELSILRAENKSLIKLLNTLNDKLTIMTAAEYQANEEKNRQIADLNTTYSNAMKELAAEKAAGLLRINQMKNLVNIEFMDKVFFESGSDVIRSEGKMTLDKLYNVLKTLKNKMISVEGYTDDQPIADSYKWKYESNWELSSARATSIVNYLRDKGIDSNILKATGFGKYNPEASNDTEIGRAQNRRIVVQLVPLELLNRYNK